VNTADNTIDPSETDDFLFDWTTRLAEGETVVSHTFVAAGVTVGTSTATGTTGTTVTVRLSAATGAIGTLTSVICRVTTSTGRILDSTWQLVVVAH